MLFGDPMVYIGVSLGYVYVCDVILSVWYNIFWWLGWQCVPDWNVVVFSCISRGWVLERG